MNTYDPDGRPVSQRRFMELFARREEFKVAQNDVGPYWISTVWLGIDHSFGEGPPLIYETMVFSPDGDSVECVRYPSRETAAMGHAAMMERYRIFEVCP